jgi:hypothetical protein
MVDVYGCQEGCHPFADSCEEYVKAMNKAKAVVITVKCKKCEHEYSYEVPAGSRGRSKPCPKCKYQDLRK